ncbi:MAG: penicillin-binding protein 1A [Gammaproteobacteria bacterium]
MLRPFLKLLVFLLTLVVLGSAASLTYLVGHLPSIESLRAIHLQVPLQVYTRDRSLIAEFGENRRAPVKLEDVPRPFLQAVLAAEDERFYQHPGVDWRAILRAALRLAMTGAKTQGGSTITMQVARNFFLTREKSYVRKLNEILLALKIERELRKDEILELYLNKIYFGHRAYGVAAAAQVYYGTDLDHLDLAELAMIAGLPKAPSRLNPITNPERARERRGYVLGRMRDLGFIDAGQYRTAVNAKDRAELHGHRVEVPAPYVAEMVRAYMVERFGSEAYTAGYRVVTTIGDTYQPAAQEALQAGLIGYDRRHGYRGPEAHHDLPPGAGESDWKQILSDYTSIGALRPALVVGIRDRSVIAFNADSGLFALDWDGLSWARPYVDDAHRGPAPKRAGDILQVGDVIRLHVDDNGLSTLAQIPRVEGAVVLLDPANGEVLALSGGFDFSVSKFNRATQARRQPGSGFKPFIYSAALEAGYTAASIVNDAPIAFYEPELDSVWRPRNYTRNYKGPIRLREALALSRNLVSVRLLRGIGIKRALRHIQRFGFGRDELPRNLSLALGTGGLSPLQVAAGYSVFANGGFRVTPSFIARIENEAGEVAMEKAPEPPAEPHCRDCPRSPSPHDAGPGGAVRAISAQNAWIMDSMLQEVIRSGTARAAQVLERHDLAGKTGTTNEHKDAWFTGYTRRLVASVWVGFDESTSLGPKETGARVALPVWIRLMKRVLHGVPEVTVPEPPGLVTVRIDRATGFVTDADNPHALFEIFKSDRIPRRHAGLPIARSTTPTETKASLPEQLF